jgi:hypothetical protein
MWLITCPNPNCGFEGTLAAYSQSCAGECTCPFCNEFFQWEEPVDEDDSGDEDDTA